MTTNLPFFGVLAGFSLLALPLLVLLHELGHAVPALLFTRAPVTMYLGSYGDPTSSWRVQVGPLEIYLKRYLFWTRGLCVHTGRDLSKAANVVIVLGGVLVSVLVAGLSFYAALAFDLHGTVKFFLFLLFGYALISLVTNLVPRHYDGMANDGMLLKMLLTNGENSLEVAFSPELKALIAQSREVAIDLGYEYISTLHLWLADCGMPYPYSLAGLFFLTQTDYAACYESWRVRPASAAVGSLPLTTEFEKVLKLSSLAQRHGFCSELHPGYLFMTASEVAEAHWLTALPPTPNLQQQLLAHYRTFDELMAK